MNEELKEKVEEIDARTKNVAEYKRMIDGNGASIGRLHAQLDKLQTDLNNLEAKE